MAQVPTTSRSSPLPGILAAAAVVLALGLLCAAPCLAAAAGSPPALASAPEQPRAPADDGAGEPVPPAFCRHGAPPSGEALRQDHAAQRAVDARHAQPGA